MGDSRVASRVLSAVAAVTVDMPATTPAKPCSEPVYSLPLLLLFWAGSAGSHNSGISDALSTADCTFCRRQLRPAPFV